MTETTATERRLPPRVLWTSVSNFSLSHLVFSREVNEKKEYWQHDRGPWLCGFRLPPFQRPAVWTPRQQARFIESAYLGLHLGVYVVNRCDLWTGDLPHPTDLWLIDGQQRLRAIDSYLSDGFPVFGLRWSELSKVDQRVRFEAVTFAQAIVHESDEARLRELYDRLNFGGTPHSEGERAT